MKRIVLLITTTFFSIALLKGQQGIGVTNPDASSAFEISSTTKGLLIPRMTTAQMNAISSPANGLLVYNTTIGCVHVYQTSAWVSTCSASYVAAWGLTGNNGTNENTNFIGTTDNKSLSFRVNNVLSGRIDHSKNNVYLGYQAGLNAGASATENTSIGHQAGQAVTSGKENLLIGYQAGYAQTTANANQFIGFQAGVATTGGNNTFLGYTTGATNTTGTNNTLLGYNANVSGAAFTNATAIGSNATVGASNSLVLGNSVNVGINTTTPQYKLDINAQTGSSGNPLRLLGLNAGATTDSVLTSSSGIVRRLGISQILGNAWQLGGNSVSSVQNLGTTSNYALPFITNNTERMRITEDGNLAIGATNTTGRLGVIGGDLIMGGSPTNLTVFPDSSHKLRIRSDRGSNTDDVFLYTYYTGNDETHLRIRIGDNGPSSSTKDVFQVGSTPNTTEEWTPWITARIDGVGIGTTTPNQQLEITNAFRFPQTTSSTTGVIYKGANRFIHDYKPSANDGLNTFVGVNSGNFTMSSPTSWLASGNTGVGANTLAATTSAGYNSALGANALAAATSGSFNTAIGGNALQNNTTGAGNTAIGNGVLQANTTASSNTAVGNGAMNVNTTGYGNAALGESTLRLNTTGFYNVAIGQAALEQNTTGNFNVGIGVAALEDNTDGFNNVAIGGAALDVNTTGDQNTAIGHSALGWATSADRNTAIGFSAGIGTTTGNNNVFVGTFTGSPNTTGSGHTLVGYNAGASIGTTSSNLTLLGNGANTTGIFTNSAAIGFGATVNASNKIRLGNSSVTLVETQGSFVTVSDRRLKKNITDNNIGLNFIKAVRPVHYELKDSAHIGITYDGFIAQEIEDVMQKQNITFSGLSKPKNTEGGYYTVSYATFVVPLVNAVKELDEKNEKTNAENAALRAELEKMKRENTALKANVDRNSQDIEAIKAMLTKKTN